jgi:hypothetical protein
MRFKVCRAIILLAFLVSAFAVAAGQPRVVVDVPCGHLTAAQCERFTALADEFMPGYFDVPVMKSTSGRAGAVCPQKDFESLERCYFDSLAARPQPIGDHLGLKNGEAALVILLFDPRHFNDAILGSSLVVARGGNLTLSSFSIHPAEIMAPKGKRSVYIIRGGSLGDSLLDAVLRRAPRKNGPFAVAPDTAFFGDLAIDRKD